MSSNMDGYGKRICNQLTEFETPPVVQGMTSTELVEYHDKMETLGCKVNVYGPKRCLLFRTFAEAARSEIVLRYTA